MKAEIEELVDVFRAAWMQSMQSDPRTDDPERIADRAGVTAVLDAIEQPEKNTQEPCDICSGYGCPDCQAVSA